MKAIIMSIRPQHVANILNGIKTLEIRKRFPSDYVGWVYIYCTKEQGLARLYNGRWNDTFVCEKDITDNEFKRMYSGYDGKGKVVARFWCDKVGEIEYEGFSGFAINMPSHIYNSFVDKFYSLGDLLRASCLPYDEFHNYLKGQSGKAIHIINVQPFDKPKELKEFSKKEFDGFITGQIEHYKCPLTRAPQSWQFIEV